MKALRKSICAGAACLTLGAASLSSHASSHMDAPLITLDPAANTTDVYVFRSAEGDMPYLTTAVAVYPFEEPGIGPNNYGFDENVRYEIHVALGDDVGKGRKTISYRFDFDTQFKNKNTILQSYLGTLSGDLDDTGFDVNQNLRQSYKVTKIDHRTGHHRVLGRGKVPPNNQGLVTPFYNQDDVDEAPAKEGVAARNDLDSYTQQAIAELDSGYEAFAGQREDGFFADIQSIFDLDFTFGGPNKPFDSQAGYNVHTIVLNIPLTELGGPEQTAGVYATTSRRKVKILRHNPRKDPKEFGPFIQVGRQGNPLFNEALVAIADKDRYNRTDPTVDAKLFKKYALNPELATALGLPDRNREDIAGIFIPDLIKVDLFTPQARLADNPDDPDFHRLSVFGGDTLTNGEGEVVAGGWPNGRRFGDDVVDIAVIALAPDVLADANADIDKVKRNDITYNKTFPYAATPLNGRNHSHH